MGTMLGPVIWGLFFAGLWGSFGFVAFKEGRARAKAAKELRASQQAMAQANADMAPPEGDTGGAVESFDDGFGNAGEAEFAEFDENAFK